MATVTLKGNPINTVGQLPEPGSQAPEFTLVKDDLSETQLKDYSGKRLVLNIFPSVDTPTCAYSVRNFNQRASELDNTVVLCISKDLPFAQKRFCATEGLNNVVNASAFRSSFGEDYGVTFVEGPVKGLLSRAVLVIDENGKVIYAQQVPEVSEEPDYEAALAKL